MKKLLKFFTGITPWQVELKEYNNKKENKASFISPNLTNFHSI